MNKALNFKPRPLALAVAVALGAGPDVGWAAAGRIQFAWGDVTVEQSGGNTVPLKRGDEIDAGDTIVTERGRAQIKFTDGSKVSLQPQTSFKVNEYSYDAKGGNAGQQRNFMSLFRGGLRAISGAIGRSNRNSYRLTTPVGTIGIRGTEYLIMLDGSGAIVTVGDGAVALVNDAGEVLLVNGQTGRIVDRSSLPKVVKSKAVVPPPPKDVKDDSQAGEPQQDDNDFQVSVSRDGGNPEQTLGNILDDEFITEETTPMEMGEEVVEEVITPKLVSGPGFAVAFSFPAYGGPMGITDKDVNVDATFEEGRLTAWQGGTGPSDIGDLSLAGVSGSDQYIGWGRWSNTSGTTENFTVVGLAEGFGDQNESLHYVTGQPTDINALLNQGQTVANYAFQIATQPTDNFGNVGTFDGGTFQLDIAATPRVYGNLGASINGNSYELDFFGVNATGGVFRDTGLSANSFNGGCSFGCNGAVAGLVAGPNADRAGVVYHIEDSANSQVISGAAVFTRDPNGPPVIIPQ